MTTEPIVNTHWLFNHVILSPSLRVSLVSGGSTLPEAPALTLSDTWNLAGLSI